MRIMLACPNLVSFFLIRFLCNFLISVLSKIEFFHNRFSGNYGLKSEEWPNVTTQVSNSVVQGVIS